MGRLRPDEPCAEYRQFQQSDGSHLDDIGQHAQQFSGDDEDLQARETVL